MSGERKSKINAVLARFEETIDQNNAVGVCSGMYLTTQLAKSPPARASSRRHSASKGISSERKSQRRMSSTDVKPGAYRDMLNGKPKQSTPVEGDADWDPFGNSDGNLDFPGDDPSNGSDDDDDDDGSDHGKARLQRRPKAKGSAGRRGLRKTRTKGAASVRRKPETAVSGDTCTTRSESDSEENNDDNDANDDSSFSLTYVGDREKYATLQRQSSDKRLHASSTRLPRGGGLEMTRQDSSSSLTRQRKSHSDHRSKTLQNNSEDEEDSSFSASYSESPASPTSSKRGGHHHHSRGSSGIESSRQRVRSGQSSSRHSTDDSASRSSPQRRTTSSSRRSTRNFGKSRNTSSSNA